MDTVRGIELDVPDHVIISSLILPDSYMFTVHNENTSKTEIGFYYFNQTDTFADMSFKIPLVVKNIVNCTQ